MSSSPIVNSVLRGVLGSRGKRTRKAVRFLAGSPRGGTGGGPGLLLGAAGLAWGVFETLEREQAPPTPPPVAPPAASASPPPGPEVDAESLRMIRLAISAANADGRFGEAERAAIVRQAAADGLTAILERELRQPQPLESIVADVMRREDAATLYVMAFTILRADEQVTGAERIYLARLADLLRLDAATVAALERDTGERIDALGDQGQPGG